MKAGELIDALKQLPPDAEVIVWETHGTNDSWPESKLQLVEYRGSWLLEGSMA